MNNKEIATEILQHVTKFDQDPAYRSECRENQAREIKEILNQSN